MYKGIVVSKGIAIGRIYKYANEKLAITTRSIPAEKVEEEINRLEEAKEKANKFLHEIKGKATRELSSEEVQIFDAHFAMLNDPMLNDEVIKFINDEKINAEAAVKKAIENIIAKFAAMDNEYFRERVKDIEDVGDHLLRALTGNLNTLLDIGDDSIILAEDLTPSQTALLDKDKLKGFILTRGGKTSHTAIMARNLMIPAIIGVKGILDEAQHGADVILDAISGQVIINPDQKALAEYRAKLAAYEKKQRELSKLKEKPARTCDGFGVKVAANISIPEDTNRVLEVNADGIGLFRSEFLYMNTGQLPDEEKQFKAYKEVVEKMAGKPVIIRTLDIGGDKELPYMDLPEEMNPFLGWRAIRISLERKDIFKTQLRAILRASNYGQIKLMFPLIASLEELDKALEILDEVKEELESENILYDRKMEVGMMIEVPSAALMADRFADKVDFFSIGTNDLIQYTVAVDRTNEKISELHTPYHPAVLRLINWVAEAAQKAGIWVGICGEAGGNSLLTPVFVGMGITELSMSPGSILEVKKKVRELSKKEAEKHVNKVLALNTAAEVEEYLKEVSKTAEENY
ncbi:MAG: phosphoenolpyruvate-protein phosphotransferase system enzyme [Clostridia bacterium]|nr:phosphoenolpyruvate-protein phosphotransferase system enzyme [Clostridia bacterium]